MQMYGNNIRCRYHDAVTVGIFTFDLIHQCGYCIVSLMMCMMALINVVKNEIIPLQII